MDWWILFILVPAVLVPVACLLGFAGCGAYLESGPPIRPAELTIVEVAATSVTLGWLNLNSIPVTFEIERTREGETTALRIVVVTPIEDPVTGQLRFQDTGLDPETTYFYQARTVRPADEESSSLTDAVMATTLP